MSNHNSQNNSSIVKLPYFDYLLETLKESNNSLGNSFSRHVHWGYWPEPKSATLTLDDFEQATEQLSHEVCKAGNLQNGLKVLDVGCGFGGTVAHINENYVRMELVGLNLDERQLARAREIVQPLADNQITFRQGDACALPFPDQSFDTILAVECIFHFPDRKQFFKEAYRVLKPGGYLALSDFIPGKKLLPLMKFRLRNYGFYGLCNFEFGVQHYQQLAKDTGFSIETESNITKNTLPTYNYLRKLAKSDGITSFSAAFETLGAEVLSKTGLLKYYIYGFKK